jgi:hypothetical protein
MNNRLLVTYKIINFVWIATPRWQLLQNKLKIIWFPIIQFWVYLMKVIIETCRVH